MAGVLDIHTTEIDGQDVERGVGRTLERTAEASHQAIGTVGRHGFDHQSACAATAQRLHQRRGYGTCHLRIDAHLGKAPGESLLQHAHCTAGAEHTDSHQNSHHEGYEGHGCLKAVFGAVDKGIIDIDPAHSGLDDKPYDDAQQEYGRKASGESGELLLGQTGRERHHTGHEGRQSNDGTQHHSIPYTDALHKATGEQADQRRDVGGDQDRQKDVGGVCRTELGTVGHDRGRHDSQTAGTQHDKHDHGIAGALLILVQFLQLGHGFESHRRSRIVESQHIGRDVHKHRSEHRMVLGQFGEDTTEEGRHATAERIDHAAAFTDLHHARPER